VGVADGLGERPAFLLPDNATLIGAAATDILLDGLEGSMKRGAICTLDNAAAGDRPKYPVGHSRFTSL
jgi:hypothetical protein